MEKTIFRVLLLTSLSGVFGKHVYVSQWKTWHKAQEYCRRHYIDLSSISSAAEELQVRSATVYSAHWIWIGLYRESNSPANWKWSGGGYMYYEDWAVGQPNEKTNEAYGFINGSSWYDTVSYMNLPFFCFHLIVVQEEKTWVEALEYCREHHTDLTSLLSQTEVLLARREIQEKAHTEHVWTGLRYLANTWLWVNGDPLQYEVWGGLSVDGRPQCPVWDLRCGAMLKENGRWEARDCQERLNFICY